eukprot:TRINITY_DN6252_c0_g6_i1.p2 TRINITY_DN6252_c0_g6~~TRINITY_DN6252_c0_g6_i1.p2  ORF type:complete len:166 (+),score=24.78 TRINITY_DN6252_c0_g6_i1:116-613(+)
MPTSRRVYDEQGNLVADSSSDSKSADAADTRKQRRRKKKRRGVRERSRSSDSKPTGDAAADDQAAIGADEALQVFGDASETLRAHVSDGAHTVLPAFSIERGLRPKASSKKDASGKVPFWKDEKRLKKKKFERRVIQEMSTRGECLGPNVATIGDIYAVKKGRGY